MSHVFLWDPALGPRHVKPPQNIETASTVTIRQVAVFVTLCTDCYQGVLYYHNVRFHNTRVSVISFPPTQKVRPSLRRFSPN